MRNILCKLAEEFFIDDRHKCLYFLNLRSSLNVLAGLASPYGRLVKDGKLNSEQVLVAEEEKRNNEDANEDDIETKIEKIKERMAQRREKEKSA